MEVSKPVLIDRHIYPEVFAALPVFFVRPVSAILVDKYFACLMIQ